MSAERLPWFRCVPSALLGALAGMGPDEGYTYVALLLRIYETGGPVAETPRTLSRRTGLTERKVAAALSLLVEAGKVTRLDDGRLDSETTHAEIEFQHGTREQQIKAGKTSAEKRAKKSEQIQQTAAAPVERPLNHLDLEKRDRDPSSSLRSEEGRVRARKGPAVRIDPAWQPTAEQRDYGRGLGLSDREIDDAAEDMRLWALGKGEAKADWDATFKGWMRRNVQRRGGTGPPSGSPPTIDNATGDFLDFSNAQRPQQNRAYPAARSNPERAVLAGVGAAFGVGPQR